VTPDHWRESAGKIVATKWEETLAQHRRTGVELTYAIVMKGPEREPEVKVTAGQQA
jgi:hypothetical protein